MRIKDVVRGRFGRNKFPPGITPGLTKIPKWHVKKSNKLKNKIRKHGFEQVRYKGGYIPVELENVKDLPEGLFQIPEQKEND